jgi:hypothetical protein
VKLAKEQGGWLWVAATTERRDFTEAMTQLTAKHVGVPQALTRAIAALDKQISEWDGLYYDDQLPAGFDDEAALREAIEAAEVKAALLDQQRDQYLQFTDAQKAYPGCVVTFDHRGKLDMLLGVLSHPATLDRRMVE